MEKVNCKDIYSFYKSNGGILSYNIFKAIVAENNSQNSYLIITLGYEYRLPYEGSILRIVKNKRRIKVTEDNNTIKGAVNWGESNKLKARLLEEGKVLYECKKDETGKIILDNGGEKWLVYHTDDFYYTWIRVSPLEHHAHNFDFTPTWSNARALIASITEDSDILYKQGKENGNSRSSFIKTIDTTNKLNVRVKEC